MLDLKQQGVFHMTEKALCRVVPLKRRKILKKSLGNVISVMIFGIIGTLIGYVLIVSRLVVVADEYVRLAAWGVIAWFIFLVILMFWRMGYQYLYYLTYFYDIDDKNLIIRKGVIARREVILPFKRITDVYLDQDMSDVFLGIYDVHISTPTEQSGRFAHIDGVDKEGAHKIRELILERIHKHET